MIVDLNLKDFYPHLVIDKQLLRYHQATTSNQQIIMMSQIEKEQQIENLMQVQNIIKRYINKDEDPNHIQQSANNISLQASGQPMTVDPTTPLEPITICAKDIILHPFVFSLDHRDDHNIAQHNQDISEEKRFCKHSDLTYKILQSYKHSSLHHNSLSV